MCGDATGRGRFGCLNPVGVRYLCNPPSEQLLCLPVRV